MTDVIARVVSQKGTCVAGHRVGDEFAVGQKAPPGMCSWAFYALFPFAEVLQFGGSFPWETEPNKHPPSKLGGIAGKGMNETTPPCDSSPQQAGGYSRWNFYKTTVACPDPENPVIFELRRVTS